MAYYLRQDKKKKGIYLQMYEAYWNKEKKQPRSRSVESFGYVSDLISDGIPDPISYYKEYVEKKNQERAVSTADETRPRAFTSQLKKNIGYFLVSALLAIYAPYVTDTAVSFEYTVPSVEEFSERICNTLKKSPILLLRQKSIRSIIVMSPFFMADRLMTGLWRLLSM
ncbi:hypothetical protein NE634_03155 [Lacrimispora saccharolytica]|nr:hypothetical protein [Lacrimispora saccharolytica]